ncbi:MAG: DUF378 domain-containing protein [Clostridia bacterium]|nr:DUF378 domain-containing protein [Clostridia bacterium]
MIDRIALLLLIVGGLNWGSIGLFQFDLVAWIFGGQDALGARIVYVAVALCALWCVSLLFRERNTEDDTVHNIK